MLQQSTSLRVLRLAALLILTTAHPMSANADIVLSGSGSAQFRGEVDELPDTPMPIITPILAPQTYGGDVSLEPRGLVLLSQFNIDTSLTVDGGSTLLSPRGLFTFSFFNRPNTKANFLVDDGHIVIGGGTDGTGNIFLRGFGDFLITNGGTVTWDASNICNGGFGVCDILIGANNPFTGNFSGVTNTGIVVEGPGSLLDASNTHGGDLQVGFTLARSVDGVSDDFLVALNGGEIRSNGGDIASGWDNESETWDPDDNGFLTGIAVVDSGTWRIQGADGLGDSNLDIGEGHGASGLLAIINGGLVEVTGNPGAETGFFLGQTAQGVPTEGGENLLFVSGIGSLLSVDNNFMGFSGSRIANGAVSIQDHGALVLDSSILLVSGKTDLDPSSFFDLIDGTVNFQRAASAGILGTWTNTSTENDFLMLQFFDDGTYVHAEVDQDDMDEISGMEWGNYFYDAGTGELTTTQTFFDENGDTGFSNLVLGSDPPFLSLVVVGDVLTINIEDEDGVPFTLDFARQQLEVTNSLVGTWRNTDTENEFLMVTFFDDSTYVHAEVDLGGVDQENGMEWGTYSRDATNGRVTATQIFDSNGDVGLTSYVDGSVAPFLFITVSGDQLTARTAITVDEVELVRTSEALAVVSNGSLTITDNDIIGISALIIGQTPAGAGETQTAHVLVENGTITVINDPNLPIIPLNAMLEEVDGNPVFISIVSNIGTGSLTIADGGVVEFKHGDFVIGVGLDDKAVVTVVGGGQLTAERIVVGWADIDEGGPGISAAETGELILDDGIVNGDVYVDNNGALRGTGIVNGIIYVDGGTVAPGFSGGTLTAKGFVLGVDSELVLEVILNSNGTVNTRASDLIVVTEPGSLDLEFGTVILELNPPNPDADNADEALLEILSNGIVVSFSDLFELPEEEEVVIFAVELTTPLPPDLEPDDLDASVQVVNFGKNDCKKGGWVDLLRDDEDETSKFEDQGDCIEYINTGK